MAGHSKWANIKHRKDRADKKKGKIFSRLMKELISAVRQGGPDPKANAKLRIAIQKAKEANVPNDNVERNIKKASSEGGEDYTEMTYELYGFGGVGILVDILTDNKNRIASEIRVATNKCGGTVATPGAVAYNFDRKGVIRIAKEDAKEDELFLLASESGAEDFSSDDDGYVVIAPVEDFLQIKESLEQAGIRCQQDGIEMIPKTQVEVTDEIADQNIALIEWLENLDDADAVFHNMKVS
jgi:YebC/PmpR family DNA-binding regulatory protein